MTFGQRLRELRKRKGMSQRDLAAHVLLDFTYLSKIENDRLEFFPSAAAICRIAEVLEADADELLRLADKMPKGAAARIAFLEQQVKELEAFRTSVQDHT